MVNKLAMTIFAIISCLGSPIASTAMAQQFQCASCGCAEKPHTKVCLVTTYEQVSIPDYVCNSRETFYPQKGMVMKQRYQNDTFIVQRKNRCNEPCLKCKTECGPERNAGGFPNGCLQTTSVLQTSGSTMHWVPVVKWIKVECCSDCGFYSTASPTAAVSMNQDATKTEPSSTIVQPVGSEK